MRNVVDVDGSCSSKAHVGMYTVLAGEVVLELPTSALHPRGTKGEEGSAPLSFSEISPCRSSMTIYNEILRNHGSSLHFNDLTGCKGNSLTCLCLYLVAQTS